MKKAQNTTIQISLEIKKKLDSLKKYRRETYNDVLMRIIEDSGKTREPKGTKKSRGEDADTQREKAEKHIGDPTAELEY
jgi:hypothetical protein